MRWLSARMGVPRQPVRACAGGGEPVLHAPLGWGSHERLTWASRLRALSCHVSPAVLVLPRMHSWACTFGFEEVGAAAWYARQVAGFVLPARRPTVPPMRYRAGAPGVFSRRLLSSICSSVALICFLKGCASPYLACTSTKLSSRCDPARVPHGCTSRLTRLLELSTDRSRAACRQLAPKMTHLEPLENALTSRSIGFMKRYNCGRDHVHHAAQEAPPSEHGRSNPGMRNSELKHRYWAADS